MPQHVSYFPHFCLILKKIVINHFLSFFSVDATVTAVTPKINPRPSKFLDKDLVLLEQAEKQIKKFEKSDTDKNEMYKLLTEEEQKIMEEREEAVNKLKQEEERGRNVFSETLKNTKKTPTEKFDAPQTTNQEIGWFHSTVEVFVY